MRLLNLFITSSLFYFIAGAMVPILPFNTAVVQPTITGTTTATATETANRATVDCDQTWCQNGISMCLYWAGVTGYDHSLGPVPGETFTTLGNCAKPTQVKALEIRKSQEQEIHTTPAPIVSIDCKYKYCDNSIQYCMYWAGVTGFDISLGPIPGMVRTSLGACQSPALTLVTNTAVSTTLFKKLKCSSNAN
ncbi:hypothetical protein EsH8_IV_000437 [Colletotrichum jinshuiense]